MTRLPMSRSNARLRIVDGLATDEVTALPWDLRAGRAALALLLEAQDCSQDLGCSSWNFAVEIAVLHHSGATASILRWLVGKGYLAHAREVTAPREAARSFREDAGLRFGRRTCFVLTQAGLRFARQVLAVTPCQTSAAHFAEARTGYAQGNRFAVPSWDAQRRELRLGSAIVKQFRVPAANQQLILQAFQEEGWPVRIDDPLPTYPGRDPKRRLHETITSLNRNQKLRLVHFLGDGTGQGISWELHPLDRSGGQGDGL